MSKTWLTVRFPSYYKCTRVRTISTSLNSLRGCKPSFISSEASLPLFVLVLQKPLTRSDQHSSKIVSLYVTSLRNFLTSCLTDHDKLCSIAKEILEQKAICQQDPDQDADEEAPEDQAEYDSVLISSAGDLVAAMANALGSDFALAFNTFYPLIAKYYVCDVSLLHSTIV